MYVGLKQPRGDGERYVTPARAAAKETRLTLEMSAFESLYGGQFILSTQLIKLIKLILQYSPPTQHQRFFRDFYPLYKSVSVNVTFHAFPICINTLY